MPDGLWVLPATLLWCAVLLLPWRPWSTRERLDTSPGSALNGDFSDIAVLIPARDEEPGIEGTLAGLARQGTGLKVVVVDDRSRDGTRSRVADFRDSARSSFDELLIVEGKPLPDGWSGKLWALHQGSSHLDRPLTLLLDADIELAPGALGALRARLLGNDIAFASVMPELRLAGVWERLLLPAFVFFFKLLYPFRLSNSRESRVAAAAGGCILLETRLLREIGGFEALRGALIDDCTLARLVKERGHRTWIGLSRSVRSTREYPGLESIWRVVARTAYTQLRHSPAWLGICTVAMVTAFVVPVAGICTAQAWAVLFGALACSAMAVTYAPTLRYYGQSWVWVGALPLIGVLYLAMTWSSAVQYHRGWEGRWKGRSYRARSLVQEASGS